MKITKTTINFAAKRNIEINTFTDEQDGDVVWFSEINEDGETEAEPMFIMYNNENDLTWKGNIYLDKSVKEELPATINSEKHLKEVIVFLSQNI
ncbi:hypothetical protein LGZ99_17310 [Photorhabdus temperata]|uniref:Uncharacterized protein n=1 Tax=Photorhabdus temperata subsp. temperata Meg1 TaxID=1393735 RepID=A0A081RVY8_PHOTE|nr:hypothetical protein [Photorhabdus temperata]KER02841.1 hypothetical protein MEG1DRAFT_02570 [Photorhabdus temperata subsp. temperata Meg1]MCT8348896.1 hypothetical protein [Photorhabdus temperata]